MNVLQRYEDILMLGQRYLYAKFNNEVYNRENSEQYIFEKGRFEGYLMACEMSYELQENKIVVINKKGKIAFEVVVSE